MTIIRLTFELMAGGAFGSIQGAAARHRRAAAPQHLLSLKKCREETGK